MITSIVPEGLYVRNPKKGPRNVGFGISKFWRSLSLTCFKPALGFVYHVNSAFTAHNAAVAMTLLERAE